MEYYFSNDDFFFGKEHHIDINIKQRFEIENSLLELGFEDDIILKNYKEAMYGFNDHKIETLKKEISHKINADYKFRYNPDKILSVSDLSSFTYCPVSYAIQLTYEIEYEMETYHGIQEHEKQHLPTRIEKYKNSKSMRHALEDIDYSKRSEDAHSFFKEIFNSRLIFSGHGSKHPRNFFGEKGNLVGCPDYIFKNERGEEIVVEEKFPTKPVPDDFHGYENHKIQILSYLFAFNNIKASHGYLVYWYRKRKDQYNNDSYSLDYYVLKVEKTMEGRENLIKVFNKFTTLNKAKLYSFSRNQINAKKCVNCSVSLYCKHKTGRYSSFSLPYDQE